MLSSSSASIIYQDGCTTYFPEPEFQGEYYKEIQTLDYHKETQILDYGEKDSQDVVNSESSGITIDQNGNDAQIGHNQEISELELGGIILDQSGDEHPITQPKTETLENMAPTPSDIPHQSFVEDVPETHKRHLKMFLRHIRDICPNVYQRYP